MRAQLVVLVIIALIPALVLPALGGFLAVRRSGAAHIAFIQDAADRFASDLDREIEILTSALLVLVSSSMLDDGGGDLATFERRARPVAVGLDTAIVLWRGNGELVAAVPTARVAASDGDAGDLARLSATTRSPLVANTTGRGMAAAIFVPIPRGDQISFVLQIDITPKRMSAIFAQQMRRDKVKSLVADTNGTMIGYSDHVGTTLLGGTALATPLEDWLRDGLVTGQTGVIEGGPAGGIVSLAAFATPRQMPNWRVAIIEPVAEYRQILRGPLIAMAVVVLLSVVQAVGAALWAGTWLAGPLRRLTAAAQAVAAGAETLADVPPSSVTEFNALRDSVARADAVLRRRAAAERMALQEARTGHELLASVVNGTADQIHVKDLDLCFVLANHAARTAGNMRREEWQVLGHRATHLAPHGDAEREETLDREVIATGGLRECRVEGRRSDGGAGTFTMVKTPWRDATGKIAGVVTVIHDVSDQRAAEQRLAAVQGDLLRATRLSAMGAMASGLAHELNQPLAAMANFLNAAARLLARVEPATAPLDMAREAVTAAAGQALRAGTIVRRLREFVGRGEADLSIDDVCDVIREICDVARADGAIDRVQLEARIGATELPALIDRTQLQQVLLNLIRNASEALGDTYGGRIVLSVRAAADGGVEITVADNGPGIAPEILDRLFEPFVSTKALGMGIGLSICRTIVEGHGGSLTCEDNPGGGTLFRITLPPATHVTGTASGRETR